MNASIGALRVPRLSEEYIERRIEGGGNFEVG
jgi:hypothetical protein